LIDGSEIVIGTPTHSGADSMGHGGTCPPLLQMAEHGPRGGRAPYVDPPGLGKWDPHDIYLEFLGKNFRYGAVMGPSW